VNLRTLLNLCQQQHEHEWVQLPGEDPARFMLAGLDEPLESYGRRQSTRCPAPLKTAGA